MNIPISTPSIQPWQIDGWLEQGYRILVKVKGYEGEVVSVIPGKIRIEKGDYMYYDVQNIPSQSARLEDPWVILE